MSIINETKEERERRLAYHLRYNKGYKKVKRTRQRTTADIEIVLIPNNPFKTYPPEIEERFFKGNIEIKCAYFGCCKTLNLIESLAGKFCVHHMNNKRKTYEP